MIGLYRIESGGYLFSETVFGLLRVGFVLLVAGAASIELAGFRNDLQIAYLR
ncbi:MAG: hypothetical protein ACTSPE_12140 [Candidatus Thorarchaeota archaeon]